MGRSKQLRIISSNPSVAGFRPYGRCRRRNDGVILRFDEYESVRLLDYEGRQQQEAAELMNVSRPTLTRIYMEARKKMAIAMVEGRQLVITEGNTDFASHQLNKTNIMMMNQKIAIPTNDGVLWPHFGKAPQVTIVTIEDGKVKESVVLEAPEHEHGAMPRFIAAQGCTDVLCGGLGAGAVNMLNQLGIQVHAGAPAIPIAELLAQYLGGTIVYGDGTCHHDGCGGHHHHEGSGDHHEGSGDHHEGSGDHHEGSGDRHEGSRDHHEGSGGLRYLRDEDLR